MSQAPFVPLRVLSSYSMLEGAIDPKAIAKLAKERGFPAIAICDRNGLYGAIPFAAAARENGIQPLIGTLLGVQREPGGPIDALALFAKDEAGWQNLCHLVSRAHLDRPLELEPHVSIADLSGHSESLIALTGAGEGTLARLFADGKAEAAAAYCDQLQALFSGRLYIELARRGEFANADPAADYPAAVVGLDATIETNQRKIAADEFFVSLFETALEPGEIITQIHFRVPEKAYYMKFRHPASGYAVVGVMVAKYGSNVRVAVTGAGPSVFRHTAAEEALSKSFTPDAVANLSVSATDLLGDIHCSAEYRAHLVKVYTRRAVEALTR